MLVITVSLIIALMNQIFKPFGEFVDNYMGKYVGCLLEYGELPSFGSEAGSPVDEDSECEKRFQKGSATAGRPPINGGSGGSSGGKGSSKNGGGSDSSDSSGGGSSGTYAGSSSRGGSRYVASRRRPSRGMESGDSAGGGKVVEIALESGGNNGFFRGSNGRNYVGPNRKRMAVAITGLTEAERKKLEKKAEGTSHIMSAGEGLQPPPKKIAVKPPEKKVPVEELPPMTIGNFIRYLFIAGIIIALVIFIGGQALQMSKSGEK
ncbi:hypothetical protein [Bdellovibrio bacteriovorus]|uniref:hypothetical protein n=1 Tax=Bdellovibrio TaxID=958 RepID=UPI0035A979B5